MRVAIASSGVVTAMPVSTARSPATRVLGPDASTYTVRSSTPSSSANLICFRALMISGVSSTTWGMGSNSLETVCDDPSSSRLAMRTAVIAYPWIPESRMRLRLLPMVAP